MFKLNEVIEAVDGKFISGNVEGSFGGVSIDSRSVKNNDIFIAIKGERFDGHNFIAQALARGARCVIIAESEKTPHRKDGDTVVLESKYSCSLIAATDTKAALAGLAYYHRKRFNLPVIAVTGSNGKTTTKEMLAWLLSSKYKVLKNEGTQNNIIGVSLNLFKLRREHELAVFEIGTNHFGEIQDIARVLVPSVGIIMNVGPAHLEFFSDLNGVLREKWSLAEELTWPRIVLVNADDSGLKKRLSDEARDLKIFSFGINNQADCMARKISVREGQTRFLIKNFPIVLNTIARHNVYNSLAAYLAARIFSVDGYDIINRFKKFEFPKSRFQVKKAGGLDVIDDAYNANPASFGSALEAFKDFKSRGKKILVIGDMLELGIQKDAFHRELGRKIRATDMDRIIAVGSLAAIACDAAVENGFDARATHKCLTAKEAGSVISVYAKKGDCLLLKGSRANKLEEAIY